MTKFLQSRLMFFLLLSGFLMVDSLPGFTQQPASVQQQSPFISGPALWNSQRISGNFGELRGNHFHSGIDYKTHDIEGLPVLAAADGFISRVKVSSGGYGRAIYITHSENVVTVYGHLRRFYAALEDSVKKIRQSTEKFDIELFPDSLTFPVKKGELIGYTGNSGSSEGPHLHFETRHRFSEKPFNPELVGYTIRDTIAPELRAVVIYRPGPFKGIYGSTRQIIEISDRKSSLMNDTVLCDDSFFIGFEAFDKAGMENNLLGIRSFQLYFDDSLAFACRIDSFLFDQTRFIQSFIDYGFYKETGRYVTLCHLLKGNKLPFYSLTHGLITLEDRFVHRIDLRIMDTAGNSSTFGFHIRKKQEGNPETINPPGEHIPYGVRKVLKTKHSTIEINPFSFYEDVQLDIREKSMLLKKIPVFSPVISVHPDNLPVNEAIAISIKARVPKKISRDKIVITSIQSNGNVTGIQGTYRKGAMHFKTRSPGDFAVSIDTTAPVTMKPYWEPDSFTGLKKIIIPVQTDLTGIAGYICRINDMWVPAAYNAKRNCLVILPEDFTQSDAVLKIDLELNDGAGNQSRNQFRFDKTAW